MYSLNVPVPAAVAHLATVLARKLPESRARVRDEHSLVIKRFDQTDSYAHLEARVRDVLAGQSPFEAGITGVGYFEEAVRGSSPVIYLAVESKELEKVHKRLLEPFGTVAGFEGENYVPHVTIARGGTVETASRLTKTPVEQITWSVSELSFRDPTHGKSLSSISLPR